MEKPRQRNISNRGSCSDVERDLASRDTGWSSSSSSAELKLISDTHTKKDIKTLIPTPLKNIKLERGRWSRLVEIRLRNEQKKDDFEWEIAIYITIWEWLATRRVNHESPPYKSRNYPLLLFFINLLKGNLSFRERSSTITIWHTLYQHRQYKDLT